MATSARLGRYGELLAARHLERSGFVVLARNWRPAGAQLRGELDIVAEDAGVLVVCEVKTRRGEQTGGPLAALTPRKYGQLRRLASSYLAVADRHWDEVRFDAVGVWWPDGGGRAALVHLRDIRP